MHRIIPFLILFVLLLSCKKEKIVYNTVADDDHELPLFFNINGKECAFDADLGLLKYTIDQASLQNFTPVIQFQSYAQAHFEDKPLENYFKNELGDLELNKKYSLTLTVNGETEEFKLLFTNLPIIQVVAHDAIIKGPKTLAKFHLFLPSQKTQVNWAGIDLHGASSLSYEKKSYGFELYPSNHKSEPLTHSFFDFKPNYKWVLNAQYIDKARLRNAVSFAVWNSLDNTQERASIQSNYVEVFINHKAMGLYNFTESYTPQLLNLSPEAVFYEGTDNSDITFFKKLAKGKPYASKWGDWEQKFYSFPRKIEWKDFEKLNKLIVEGSDSDFKYNIGNLVDLDNLIDYYLLVNLANAHDNVGKNYNFLKRSPDSKFTIVPWDLDGTWGRSAFGLKQDHLSMISNRLFDRLIETNPDNYRVRLKNRWNELRLDQFSNTTLTTLFANKFDELVAYDIIALENTLWNASLNIVSERNYILSWLDNRLNFLDTYFQ